MRAGKNFDWKKIGMFILAAALILVFVAIQPASAQASRFNVATNPVIQNPLGDIGFSGAPGAAFNREMCGGQDFILQVSPTGCIPSVVRSDLLEEQNVPVFCPIVATQLNPLININTINSVGFSGQLPAGVSGAGYYPPRAAIRTPGISNDLPVLNNVGYAVIVLRQQPNENAMPDFVEGNLTARMMYNVGNAFGVGRGSFHLPETSDAEWNREYRRYSFWQGLGYLRASAVDSDAATISLYSDRENIGLGRTSQREISSARLTLGQTSSQIYIPGFNYCSGSMQLRLDGLVSPDTRIRLEIDGDSSEWQREEKFLENKCSITNFARQGLTEKVTISCQQDAGTQNRNRPFTLSINPRVEITVDDITRNYSVGDALLDGQGNQIVVEQGTKTLYLGYITTKGDTGNENNLTAVIAAVPGTGRNPAQLTQQEIDSFAGFLNRATKGRIIEDGFFSQGLDFLGRWISPAESLIRSWVTGDSLKTISFGTQTTIFEKNFIINGFAGPQDVGFDSLSGTSGGTLTAEQINNLRARLRANYEESKDGYEEVQQFFSPEVYERESPRTLGELALYKEIELLNSVGQKRTAAELCREFGERFPSGQKPAVCNDFAKLSSTESAVQTVVVGGRVHTIVLEGIREPTFDELGATIQVSGMSQPVELRKGDIFTLNETSNDYLQLQDVLDDGTVRITVSAERSGATGTASQIVAGRTQSHTLRVGLPETYDTRYTFTLQNANLQKLAKVSVIPKINNQFTETSFSFRIGIEKRGIQLSPEKTRERIDLTNERLEQLNSINDQLANVVETGKTMCLAVGGALMVKNFFNNLDGKGVARQQVMRGPDGYFEICERESAQYTSTDACLSAKNDEIERAVNQRAEAIRQSNQQMSNLQAGITTQNFLGEDVVDSQRLAGLYITDGFKSELRNEIITKGQMTTIRIDGQDVRVDGIINDMSASNVAVSQARDLAVNARLMNSHTDAAARQIARSQVESGLISIHRIISSVGQTASYEQESQNDVVNAVADVYSNTQSVQGIYRGSTAATGNRFGIPAGAPVQLIVFNNQKYMLELERVNNQEYRIKNIYNEAGMIGSSDATYISITGMISGFRYYDRTTYQNECTNCEIRYYEEGQYRGLPALVPFDVRNGWYAATKPTLPIGGELRPFDNSGRATNYYICNVGPNKRMDGVAVGDDVCQGFFPGANQPPVFPGLTESEVRTLQTSAQNALQQAANQYRTGVGQVTIDRQTIRVGPTYVGVPDVQCQDFMSPNDCKVLFNMCDPFMCPNSRCDLGGKYPVSNVIQSGIAGSIALCLPNAPEVIVPICVSGVHAGLSGYISVLEAYQQCLEENLETGRTTGVCDALHSIYMCEFVWRQGLPVAKFLTLNIGEKAIGQGSRGGGEYLTFREAFENAGRSVDFFTQQYAVESFRAFRARATNQAGTEVCRNYLSLAAPDLSGMIDALTRPDVPPQFYGRFDEISMTTATVPPISHYKVFFHVFAGNDFPAYYQVYLRGTGQAFFVDTPIRAVHSGVIRQGESATQTIDFTAPTGYNQLCIVVNNQEECGFKQVSTDFGIQYLADRYASEEAARTNITSEAACISGTPNVLSLLNPNVQAGAEELVNPAIYNRGITRICATENPGRGTDANWNNPETSRWKNVGHCGDPRMMCWLDAQSVQNAIRNIDLENQALQDVGGAIIEQLRESGEYMSPAAFDEFVDSVRKEENPQARISMITENFAKAFFNREKGYLTLLRADAFSEIAKYAYEQIKPEPLAPTTNATGNITTPQPTSETPTIPENIVPGQVSYPIFEFRSGGFLGIAQSSISFLYMDGKWWWCVEDCIDSDSNVATWYIPEAATSPASPSLSPIPRLSATDRNFVGNMTGKNYLNGMLSLISRTTAVQDRNPKLVTQSVEFTPDRIFSVNPRNLAEDISGPIRFEYLNGVWHWSAIGSSTPRPVSENSVFGSQALINLEKALVGKIERDGAAIIFSIDTQNPLVIPGETGSSGGGTTPIVLNCTDQRSCQTALGNEAIKIATEVKQQRGNPSFMSNEVVMQSTGGIAKSFECLVLMQAQLESQISHCSQIQVNGNPLYCDGNAAQLTSGDEHISLGIMQINKNVHGEKLTFKENVEFGANLLAGGYAADSMAYRCYRPEALRGLPVRAEDFEIRSYFGWQRALRNYNGWNSLCFRTTPGGVNMEVGNPRYVDDVLRRKDAVAGLFPQCA